MTKKQTYAPVKPARSFEEQARRLTALHGLDIEKPDRARHIFSTVNYYRFLMIRRPPEKEGRPRALYRRRDAGYALPPVPV